MLGLQLPQLLFFGGCTYGISCNTLKSRETVRQERSRLRLPLPLSSCPQDTHLLRPAAGGGAGAPKNHRGPGEGFRRLHRRQRLQAVRIV